MKKIPFALLTGLGVLVFSVSGIANTITVDSTADGAVNPGVCVLRAAIKAAETHNPVDTCAAGVAGEDTIEFASGLTGVIQLNSQLPDLTESLRINGPGAGSLTVDVHGANDGFHIDDGGTHHAFTINGLTLKGAANLGISSFGGNLTLDAMVVTQNHSGAAFGHADDTLTITNSAFADNGDATTSGGGGGLNFLGGHLILSDSTVSGNQAAGGGGIQVAGDLTNCVSPCSADITNVTISDNKTTGSAGGIGMGASVGPVPVTLTNVTIADNHSNTDGGTGGVGGGIYVQSNIEATLENTLVANNVTGLAGTIPDDCQVAGGTLASNGANLVREFANCTGLVTSDITGQDPLLAALANNGGPTQTRLLLDGSPAIDAAKATDAPSTDQRGVSRPLGSEPDIGAVEVGCGDGALETGETCDDGLANSDTQADACRTDCTEARCGDHVIDSGENCDDGNTDAGDGCDETCQTEAGAGTTGGTATSGSTGGSSSSGGCSLIR